MKESKSAKVCQCHSCNQLFAYSDLSSNPRYRHISSCCHASYSILSPKLDRFFDKYLDVNNDPRYYEYKR